MVESMDQLTDEFGRPLRFSPTWPPKPPEKTLPNFKPGYSLAFRKSNWPPPTDEISNDASSSSGGVNGLPAAPSTGSQSAQGASPSQNNAAGGGPGATAGKSKKSERDYSAFFGKNALPHHQIKFVVKPDKVHLPEVFLGGSEEDN